MQIMRLIPIKSAEYATNQRSLIASKVTKDFYLYAFVTKTSSSEAGIPKKKNKTPQSKLHTINNVLSNPHRFEPYWKGHQSAYTNRYKNIRKICKF